MNVNSDFQMINILRAAIEKGASDVYIIAGGPVTFKIHGKMIPFSENDISHVDTEVFINEIYEYRKEGKIETVYKKGDDDFSFAINGLGRFRCNVYMQRGSLAAIFRIVKFDLPDFTTLNIPEPIMDLSNTKKGLVLFTGPTCSGKSTTLASVIDNINTNQHKSIITIEDPIEFIHKHKKSLVSQREVGHDVQDCTSALKSALKQSPDVLLMEGMQDFETAKILMNAAETGKLVFSTLYTVGASKTIDRIIDIFPPAQQQQARVQLATVLQAVVSQQLIPGVDGGLVPAFEIMHCNSTIKNMIRESKVFQIDNVVHSGGAEGMRTMDNDLLRLYNEGKISAENALLYATNKEVMAKKLMNRRDSSPML